MDSPTSGKVILKIFLALLATKARECKSIDIKAAFLWGHQLQRDIFLHPPKEAANTEGVLWKLNKCVYGLNDASRVWYFSVRFVLLMLGCCQLKADPSMFYWHY